MTRQVDLFSFVFWKNWRHRKFLSKLTGLWNQDAILVAFFFKRRRPITCCSKWEIGNPASVLILTYTFLSWLWGFDKTWIGPLLFATTVYYIDNKLLHNFDAKVYIILKHPILSCTCPVGSGWVSRYLLCKPYRLILMRSTHFFFN